MKKKVLIIGGGLTGLATGIYGQLQGYQTEIHEMHSLPGGVCTSWDRKGYTFDGAFHWWIGSIPQHPFYRYFQDLGVFPETEPIQRDIFVKVLLNGESLTVYYNLEKFRAEMLRLAPEDAETIDSLIADTREFGGFVFPMDIPPDALGFKDFMKIMKNHKKEMKTVGKAMKISVQEYCRRFRSPLLKEALVQVFGADVPLFVMMSFLSAFDNGDGTFPRGGALAFVKRIEKRYLELGGKIVYKSRVQRIITEMNRAVGLVLADGSRVTGDWVISTADGRTTIYDLLGGLYTNRKIEKLYASPRRLFKPILQISFGVDADLSHHPHNIAGLKGETVNGLPISGYLLKHYCYDPTLAPKGKSIVVLLAETEYEPWKALNETEYKAAKKAVAAAALKKAEEHYPEIKDRIEATDVATPLTYQRYAGLWRAAFEGWRPSVDNLKLRIPKTLPRLKNFRMAGQWVEPGGGIPTAVLSGRSAVYMICREDKMTWNENNASESDEQ